jgi:hypothetical protein
MKQCWELGLRVKYNRGVQDYCVSLYMGLPERQLMMTSGVVKDIGIWG